MLDKLTSALNVFRKGEAVADPAMWKSGQVSATMLGGLVIAVIQLAKAFNYDIPMDADTATAIAGGVIAAVNFILTLTTSTHVGILPPKEAAGVSGQPAGQSAVSQDATGASQSVGP